MAGDDGIRCGKGARRRAGRACDDELGPERSRGGVGEVGASLRRSSRRSVNGKGTTTTAVLILHRAYSAVRPVSASWVAALAPKTSVLKPPARGSAKGEDKDRPLFLILPRRTTPLAAPLGLERAPGASGIRSARPALEGAP